jgi:putative ATP-dependent endonuclease of OLD family
MFLSKITVQNFRLLKDFSIDLEKELSLIIGKNNSGKTSLLYLLDKIFHWRDKGGCIHIDDFNLDYKKSLVDMLVKDEVIDEKEYQEDGVRLRLYIKYNDDDDLSNVGLIMMDLDENNYYVVLGYDYVLPYEAYCRLREKAKANADKHKTSIQEEVEKLLDKSIVNYFVLRRKSIAYDAASNQINENDYIDLKTRPQFHEDALISIGYIDAKRQVANKENDKTLSLQTAELFNQLQSDDNEVIDNFIQTISESDKKLGEVYNDMFCSVLDKVEEMGGVKPKETKLRVTSSLKSQNLLKGNTKVVYEHTGVQLPEDHNGLGYMNLISMIFQIEIIRQTFMKGRNGKMADINLLIIEEPEAHTHPQMQYIFIKNIKKLLNAPLTTKAEYRKIQSIISTHSSHIVSESEFGDIKYMRRTGNEVIAKNLKDLQNEYDNDEQQWYTFLKHYLTLSRSELFFADKAIFIEGDTERILLPILMKKLDQEELCDEDKNELPLCKQNISIIEVGAYSHIFGKFINFIGLEKAVVFTDLDVGHKINGKGHILKTKYVDSDEMLTSNNALKKYFKNLKDGNDLKVNKLLSLTDNQKVFTWSTAESQWKQDENGNMRVCFQVKESNYQARTFEDNFFAINKDFLQNNKDTIRGLDEGKLKDYLDTAKEFDEYDLAEAGIESKATFAVEIIFNSVKKGDNEFCGWNIPQYIKDGLLWIRK